MYLWIEDASFSEFQNVDHVLSNDGVIICRWTRPNHDYLLEVIAVVFDELVQSINGDGIAKRNAELDAEKLCDGFDNFIILLGKVIHSLGNE